MFNLSFYKKKLKKLLLPINRIIGSFFTELNRSKSQSNRQTPLKKKIIQLDGRIESFFDKFYKLVKLLSHKYLYDLFLLHQDTYPYFSIYL